jgi:hypothetical protein
MRKTAGSPRERKTGSKENLNLLREVAMTIRDEDNMLSRVLKVKLKNDGSEDRFESLKVFPPKWWR